MCMYICIYIFELHIQNQNLNISSIYWFGSGMATSRTLFNYPGFDHCFLPWLGVFFFFFWGGGACSDRKGLQ